IVEHLEQGDQRLRRGQLLRERKKHLEALRAHARVEQHLGELARILRGLAQAIQRLIGFVGLAALFARLEQRTGITFTDSHECLHSPKMTPCLRRSIPASCVLVVEILTVFSSPAALLAGRLAISKASSPYCRGTTPPVPSRRRGRDCRGSPSPVARGLL